MASEYTFIHSPPLDPPWSSMMPVVLGEQNAKGLYILVEKNGQPWGVFALGSGNRGECWFGVDAICWDGMIVIGFAERIYVVNPCGVFVNSIDLDEYFCAFAHSRDWLLVATGACVLRIGQNGQILWQSRRLAIDGIVIEGVEDGRISGAGEWDPPGGWREFSLTLADGTQRTKDNSAG